MRLDSLYRMVFDYPHGWSVALAGESAESVRICSSLRDAAKDASAGDGGANHRADEVTAPSVQTCTG